MGVRKHTVCKRAQNNPKPWPCFYKTMYDIPVSALSPLCFQESLAKRVLEHSTGKAVLKAAEDAECFEKEWNNKRSTL